MFRYVLLLAIVIVGCKKGNQNNPVTPNEKDFFTLKVTVFEENKSQKYFLNNIVVKLDSFEYKTNEDGVVLFDSLSSKDYNIEIQDVNYLKIDTLISVKKSSEIEIGLLRLANEISWISTEGLNGRYLKMVSHPDGFLLASPSLSGESGQLSIALETGKGMFAEGIALGLVLLGIALVVNMTVSIFRR